MRHARINGICRHGPARALDFCPLGRSLGAGKPPTAICACTCRLSRRLKTCAFRRAYNLLAGTALSYPYLTDALSTTFYMLGVPLNLSLVVPGTLLMALTYAGYMLLAQQILGGRYKAVAVAALLFFFNGDSVSL